MTATEPALAPTTGWTAVCPVDRLIPDRGVATGGRGSGSWKGVSTTGHRFGEQEDWAPFHVPPCEVQEVSVSVPHEAAASAKQQAPAGCGHGLGEQVLPFPS